MAKYRFKTEAEFVKEFGASWMGEIDRHWNPNGSMDFLFNTPFEVDDRELKKVLGGDCTLYYGGWTISRDMITPIDGCVVSIDKEESIKVQVQSFYKLNDSLFR